MHTHIHTHTRLYSCIYVHMRRVEVIVIAFARTQDWHRFKHVYSILPPSEISRYFSHVYVCVYLHAHARVYMCVYKYTLICLAPNKHRFFLPLSEISREVSCFCLCVFTCGYMFMYTVHHIACLSVGLALCCSYITTYLPTHINTTYTRNTTTECMRA
jgi:hypothetical protein